MNLLLTGAYQYTDSQINQLISLGCKVVLVQDERLSINKNALNIELSDINIIVCNGLFMNNDIAQFNGLKFIQLTSAGLDKIPLNYIENHDIQLANAKGIYSIPMAEWVIVKILEIYKNTRYFEEAQRRSEWMKNRNLLELNGKIVGIIGTGSVGIEVAKRLKVFGCNVMGFDNSGNKKEYFDECKTVNELNLHVGQCDIVVLTLPLTDKSKHIINYEMLNSMKDDAVLVNVSRGGIINEEDLIAHLEKGKLRGVALDVFEMEPLEKQSILWDIPRVLITPHNSFISDNTPIRMFELIYRNIKAFKENMPLLNELKSKKNV
ncbi:hypothetical protein BK120_15845 [Paenibacillus sp. FSL A5-0031]|uniref:NAD(P)-dependent oxidoreductase n=1 Tax=Paenibacillus sp. FSL A5-0031 TaxID=1920420 RepID=UPI00096C9D57|nr:NAD(P)-dependent oxidoreductase [Paenibacillus sp. FSL A5-0031]OME82142.1 hypothetical protein BK120_15845 [Paenibacillus sp. FSL A5-0031]